MVLMYALFEHASGYALFLVKEFEEVGMLLPQVEAGVKDLGRFQGLVRLTAFSPFKSGANALDNINAISEGILHEDLKNFLETNIPAKSKDGSDVRLGVADSKISAAIFEGIGIKCQHSGVAEEILRGIRLHFPHFVTGLSPTAEAKAQLGLGHSYSRAKVKFNIHRVDNMIIQAIALLDQLDKDINTFAMRVREWYSYHFPELVKIVPDNYTYARVACFVKSRKDFGEEMVEPLEEIVMDSSKAKAVYDASRMSMGMDISEIDLINIERFAKRVVALADYRKTLFEYLADRMKMCAPNLASLIGDLVGARLISHAGSLTNLAKYPASTVQILGAEKALFRALKTRGNTPKYGLIFHSTFIGRAGAKNKGRISRYLANKCSIASRIDCFSENPSSVFGDHLKQQVEDRLKFYEDGAAPTKNVDVMKQACIEYALQQEKAANEEKKKKKEEKKKRKSQANETSATNGDVETKTEEEVATPKKKKKKNEMNTTLETTLDSTTNGDVDSAKKKKKKKKDLDLDESADDDDDDPAENLTNGKKNKEKRSISESTLDESIVTPKKKKKKNKGGEADSTLDQSAVALETPDGKKKKKNKSVDLDSSMNISAQSVATTPGGDANESAKKKKKKSKSLESSKIGEESTPKKSPALDQSLSSEKKKKKKKKTSDD